MSEYNVITIIREPRSRSQRLRDSETTSTVAQITIEGGSSAIGHTHDNKIVLDAINIDDNGYVYLTQKTEGADDSATQKAKSGYSDDAGRAIQADNASKWDSHNFDDYLNQHVRTGDIVQFLNVIARIFRSPDFVPGMETGIGFGVDEQGNLEAQSLTLRSFLRVPHLVYNKVSVTGGEMWNTEGGTITAVKADTDSDAAYILTMEVEDGDAIGLQVDDICKGHFNSSGGFITSYFRVTAVNQAAKTIRVVLGAAAEVPGGVNAAPVPYMNIARYGNFTIAERQQSQYFSTSEQRIALLSGVDNYIITTANYRAVLGNIPTGLIPTNIPITGDASIYLKNVLAQNFFQLDAAGAPVKMIRDRALWTSSTASSDEPYVSTATMQDEVYHRSCKYRCIVSGTLQEPRYDATDWLLVAGDTTLALEVSSSDGETFLYGHLATTLTARVLRGVTDITADILATDWSWTRNTGNVVEDSVWNNNHALCTNTIVLTNEDLNVESTGRFICQAYVRDGQTTITQEIEF